LKHQLEKVGAGRLDYIKELVLFGKFDPFNFPGKSDAKGYCNNDSGFIWINSGVMEIRLHTITHTK